MQSPFQNLSRFDEPTQPGVTMTESRTRCAPRGMSHSLRHTQKYYSVDMQATLCNTLPTVL